MVNIRFVTDPKNDLVSRAIRSAQMGYWCSHCEVETRDGSNYLGAHADGGVAIRPKGYDARFAPIEVIVSVPATPAQEDAFFGFLEAQVGKPYDMRVIGGFVDGMLSGDMPDWHRDGHWICSELVAAALEHAGIILPFPNGTVCVMPVHVYFKLSEKVDLSRATPAAATHLVAMEVSAIEISPLQGASR